MDKLEDILGEAWDKAQSDGQETPVQAPETPHEALRETQDAVQEPVEEAPAQGSPDRDERGRFLKREEVTATEPAPKTQAFEPTAEPPASWSPQAKSTWATLSPEIRAEVLRREGEYTRETQGIHEKFKGLSDLATVLEPRRVDLERNYGTAANAVKNLLDLSDFSLRDPMGFLRWFVQARGLDLSGVTGGQSAPPAPQETMLNSVQQRINQLEHHLQQRAENDAMERVKAFWADQRFPHSKDDSVRDRMQRLLEAGLATTLEDAYEQAVWVSPSVRETLVSDRVKAVQTASTEEAARRLKEARQAGAIARATSSGASKASSTAPKSIDDVMNDAFERSQASA